MKEAPTRGKRAGAEEVGDVLNTATLPDPATATELNSLSGDTAAAVAFLDQCCPGGPWVLTSIVPDGDRTTTATFSAPTLGLMRRWIDARQGKQNIYFTVNVVFGDVEVKPNKGAISAIRALHVDVDPRVGEEPAAERARALRILREYDPAPSVIVDSGGGMQAFWLAEGDTDVGGSRELSQLFRRIEAGPPLTADEQGLVDAHLVRLADVVEARNLKIETDLQADACHNADRIMRLPGTVNVPGEKKRKKGRVARLATVVDADWSRRYALGRFAKANIGASSGLAVAVTATPATGLTLDDLPPAVSDRTKAMIVQGNDPDSPNADRSRVVFGVVCDLVRASCTDEQMLWAILNPDHKISAHVLEQKGALKYARRQVAQARAAVAEGGKRGDGRPRVVVNYNRRGEMLDAAEDALLASGLPLYQSAGAVVTPVRHHGGALRLSEVSAIALQEYMTTAANFVRVVPGKDGGASEDVPSWPEPHFTMGYVARAGLRTCRLPALRGLVGHPTIRSDGSMLWAEGWDPVTGLIVDHGGVEFPQVPDEPTMEEALAALATLKAVIKDFPFVPGPSRSVALSAMLTAVCRRSLDFAPVHAFNAPSPETGKSLLSDLPAMIATGEPAAKHAQERDPEEDQKSLLGVLMQGDPVVVIDNVDRPVEGAAWCMILTSPEWEKRGLGGNTHRRVLTNVLFIFNGNNIEFRGDMATRAVMATIDAGVEEPAARTFDVDLREDVPKRRGELVSAALTVLRGHVVAGFPGAQRDTRFGGWSRIVRGALTWLGEPDPWESRHAVRGGDSARDEAVRLMEALAGCFGREAFAARDVCHEGGWHGETQTDAQRALADALDEVAPTVMKPRGGPDAGKVGLMLKRRLKRIVRGRAVVLAGHDKLKGNLYRIEVAGDGSGMA